MYDSLSCWCSLDEPCHVDEYVRAIHCEHRLRDVEGRSCLLCRECLHRDITVEGARAVAGTATRCLWVGECGERILRQSVDVQVGDGTRDYPACDLSSTKF